MTAGGHGVMTETLYLDLFFLVNLAADCYLLFLTGLVLRELRFAARHRKGGASMTYIENVFICIIHA